MAQRASLVSFQHALSTYVCSLWPSAVPQR